MMAEKQKELIVRLFGESENVIEAIFKLFSFINEHFSEMSPAFRLDMEKYHEDIIRKLGETNEMPYSNDNEEMLRRGIMEGVFRKDIDIKIANKCIYEMLRLSNDKNSFDADEKSKKIVFRDFYINYLRGISTRKGLDLINYYDKK
jgi:hypothetical protein